MITALFMITLPGCHVCKAAKPVFRRMLEEDHPGAGTFHLKSNPAVKAAIVDVTTVEWKPVGRQKWTPEGFPTYALRLGNKAYVTVGGMSKADLEAWLRSKGVEA